MNERSFEMVNERRLKQDSLSTSYMYTYYSMKLISTAFCFIAIMIILLSINLSFDDVLEWGCMLHNLKVMNEFFR